MIKVNWFMVAGAILMVGAAVTEIMRSNWTLAAVYICYGIANAVLSIANV